jgi:hypothetical protein
VCHGEKVKMFMLKWIPGVDQIADGSTKTQEASKLDPHVKRTLIQLPDRVRGYISNTIGNR